MANNIHGAIALTGGTVGSLDNIDGVGLADKDIAIVSVQGDKTYHYVLNATSAATESSPDIIAPDVNALDKRWILSRAVGGHRELIVNVSDVTNSDTNVLANVTGLSFAVTAGVLYRFHGHICYTVTSRYGGARWIMTGPASPTQFAMRSEHPYDATSSTLSNATDFTTPSSTSSYSQTSGVALIDGFVMPSTNGTMQLQFASETSSYPVTVLAGSALEVW